MGTLHIVGIDISKRVFHLHGADHNGNKLIRHKLFRKELLKYVEKLPRCLIVMEACGGSNHWGREFTKIGHTVKLINAKFVKPFVKTNKNDFNDAEAIVEAAMRPSMRFVHVKSLGQQELQFLHRSRQRLVETRTGLSNQIRGFLHEYGHVVDLGKKGFINHVPEILADEKNRISKGMIVVLERMYKEFHELNEQIAFYDGELMMYANADEDCKRVLTIPGVGPLTATAVIASMPDPKNFKNGREFAAWLGLVPKQYSTGGKNTLRSISKRGDSYVRYLLIHGARSLVQSASVRRLDPRQRWYAKKLKEKGTNKACVAMANKNARVIWAMLIRNEDYKRMHAA